MANPGRTQKQIAERYKTNLGYYKRLHPWRRARLIVSLIVIAGGLFAVWYFQKRGPEKFFNAGPLSAAHANLVNKCEACHDQRLMSGGRLTPAQFRAVVRERFHNGIAFDPIDQKCESCHQHHNFHEASVVTDRSCSACHQEHGGPQSMTAVASSQCTSCHGDAQIMQASARKGATLDPALFSQRHPQPPQKVIFSLPRPPNGYTRAMTDFWTNHPEFQLNVEKLHDAKVRDPDTLRFNHQRHFAVDIPPVDRNGTKLDCNYCHKPETEGRFMRRISYEESCQPCHSLQFDVNNPEMALPHGDATAVLGYLRALPTHYEDVARNRGMSANEIRPFVQQQLRQLRAQYGSDEELLRAVFYTVDPYKPQSQQQHPGVASRASFAGCRFCHEVKPASVGAPLVTKPILVDRWMTHSDFNHAKHARVRCDECHHATQSRETSDILMPVKANCVACHSPAGKIAAECITCHGYHLRTADSAMVGTAR